MTAQRTSSSARCLRCSAFEPNTVTTMGAFAVGLAALVEL